MATGGARPGAGAKKNQHRISVGELRVALEKELGMPYANFLAEVQLKLYKDFKEGKHAKEFISFTNNMGNRIIEQQTDIQLTAIGGMSKEELEAYRQSLIQKSAT